ncbi:MAG: SpoIVB peptidase [Oscillospiraceae bacterium]|nr:SpoIVB peptidase [Oscillospiraceae bacterium]
MFYRIYKFFAAILVIMTFLTISAVFVFERQIPEKFYSESKSSLSLPGTYGKFFSFDFCSNKTAQAMQTAENSYTATVKFMNAVPVKTVNVAVTDEQIVVVCGSPFGVKMFTDGVLVVGFSNIETLGGSCCPGAESGLQISDLIKAINKNPVYTNEEVAEYIKNSGGNSLEFEIVRDESTLVISIQPKMLADKSGYKAGFWVRDSSAGIGTMTFYNPETMAFAGLGHAVCDIDTKSPIPFSTGEIVPAAITKINKGVPGVPGELGGAFTGGDMGDIKINSEAGLYGILDYEIEGFSAPIAHKQEVYEGAAVIYSTLEGCEVVEYDIEIIQVNLSDDSLTKNMIIRVTDEDLIALSGGIVQGMSGSPIVQNGKLVGAVTHVFVNDPTKGYGIFAENMLEVAG